MYDRNSKVFGFWVPIFFVFIGYAFAQFFYSPYSWIHNQSISSNSISSNSIYYAELTDSPVIRSKSVKAMAKILPYKSPFKRGKAILYFEKDSASLHLQSGQIIALRAKVTSFPKPKNEAEFDISAYRFKKGYLQTAFVPATQWQSIGKVNTPFLDLRNALLNRISKAFKDSSHADVAHALVFGYEDAIDEDIKSAFQQSGIIHVLAVSGMHVSIIWLILSRLFFFLNKTFTQRLLQLFLILFLLWLYAAITGFSPSILRATIMFSFLSWAKLRRKSKSTWNLLCVSAFFMLLVSPSFLFDPGFWLSFLAVIGIMLFGPRIQQKVENYSWLKRFVFELISITLIAQLFTMFYAIFMFGTFPNWFLLNNIIAVPLSSLTLLEGLLYLVFSDIPLIGNLLGRLFEFLVLAMIASAQFFQNLPFSYSMGIPFNLLQLLLAYTVLTLVICAFFLKKKKIVFYIFPLCFLFLSIVFYNLNKRNDLQELVFYAIKNASYVECIENGKAIRLHEMGLKEMGESFSVHPFKRKNFLSPKSIKIPTSNYIKAQPGSMFFFHQKFINSWPNVQVDIWNICGNVSIPKQDFIAPRLIILHGNTPEYSKEKWKRFAVQNHIYFYDLQELGMLRISLSSIR